MVRTLLPSEASKAAWRGQWNFLQRIRFTSNGNWSFLVYPEPIGIEAKQAPRPRHMLRQWRRHVDFRLALPWMRDDQSSGMEMQFHLHVLGWEFLAAFVFVIADDGMADHGHVRAQLVLASRDGLQ